MPECSTCNHQGYCYTATPSRRMTRIRRCTSAILNDYFKAFTYPVTPCVCRKKKVLEIGFGATHDVEKLVNGTGTLEWFGIDPKWNDHPERNIFKGSACKIPFRQEYFDIVLASNSMEHWAEFGEGIDDGLKEILRVLKPHGIFVCIVPMHSHGSRIFKFNRIGKVLAKFNPFNIVGWRTWKNDMNPADTEYMLEIEAVK